MTEDIKKVLKRLNAKVKNYQELMEYLISEHGLFIRFYETNELDLSSYGYDIVNSKKQSVITSYISSKTYKQVLESGFKHALNLAEINNITNIYESIINNVDELISFDDWDRNKYRMRSYSDGYLLSSEYFTGFSNKGLHLLFSDDVTHIDSILYLEDRIILLNKIIKNYENYKQKQTSVTKISD